jgi:hypothetical protein
MTGTKHHARAAREGLVDPLLALDLDKTHDLVGVHRVELDQLDYMPTKVLERIPDYSQAFVLGPRWKGRSQVLEGHLSSSDLQNAKKPAKSTAKQHTCASRKNADERQDTHDRGIFETVAH